MRRVVIRFCLLAVACLLPGAVALAQGLQTKHPAVVYDAPSDKANAKFILAGGYWLSPISRVHGWHKIRTHTGDSGWLAETDVRRGNGAVVVADRGAVRAQPNANAAAVFYTKRGVMMQVLQREKEWVKVVHPDGESGYIATREVWLNF